MDLETAGAVTALALGIVALLGVFYRYVLLPQLDDRFARVDNTKAIDHIVKQVSENHHSNAEPTVPDRIDDVRKSVDEVKDEVRDHVADLKQDVRLLVAAYEGRTQLTEAWMTRTEDALANLSSEIGRVWTELDVVKRQQTDPPTP